MLKAAQIFGDHMVLQQEKTIAVWGTAEPGAEVRVTMQGRTASAVADRDGKWMAQCGPYKTSFGEDMTVSSGQEALRFTDVQIGEVWLAGGQSNMEFHMRYDADMAAEKGVCKNDNIRFFDYPEVSYVGQTEEADYWKQYGFWRKADAENLERFSAVGYYFAKELQAKYQIPIGIIGCNWGGTPVCAWMSEEAIKAGGGQVYLEEYDAAVEKLDIEAYDAAFRSNPMSYRTDQLADPIGDLMMFGCTQEEFTAKLSELGVDLTKFNLADLIPPMGPKFERRPSCLYISMLSQLVPYGIRGFLFYQGETDGDTHPECYRTLFPTLIRDWRQLWGQELPFLFVQLAPLEQWLACVGEAYVQIREAQQHTADTVPGTGMAVITDAGMQHDIHPKKKQPVGQRLALLAENKVYGEDVLCEAPTLTGVELRAGEILLTFDNVGDGLFLADAMPDGSAVAPNRLGGLQLFQNGRELNAGALAASASGNRVMITGGEIVADADTVVKLAETGWYQVNLYNSARIPARPAELSNN